MMRFLTLLASCVLVAQAADTTTNRVLRAAASTDSSQATPSTGNQYWKGPSTSGSKNTYWSGGGNDGSSGNKPVNDKGSGSKPVNDEGSGNKPVNTTYWNENYSPGQVGYSAHGSGSGSVGSTQTRDDDSKNQGDNGSGKDGSAGSSPSPSDGSLSSSAPGGGNASSPAGSGSSDQQSTTETPATGTSSASTGISSASKDTSSSTKETSSASTGTSLASTDTSSSIAGQSSSSTGTSSTSTGASSTGGNVSSTTGTSSTSTDTSSTSSTSTGGSSAGKNTMSIVTETSAGSLDSLISTMGTSSDTSDTSNNVVQSLKEKGSSEMSARSADFIAWPTSKGTVPLGAPKMVTATAPFNGGMKTYKRSNVVYKSGAILKRQNAVFVVKAGGTLRNVIIAGGGGVFCETHNCALVNVWFLNSVQGSLIVNSGAGVTTLTGGGAKNVAHRVVYSQGSGTVVVSGGFYMETSGRLFESCGTCGPVKRGVIVDGVVSVDPTAELVRVNQNYNDRATIAKATITTQTTIFDVCARYKGGPTPTKIGAGPNPPVCSYTDASVKINSIDRIVPAV